MKPVEMKPGWRYIVTQASSDGTFRVGDHVRLETDGAITCREAMGWIDAEDVPAAIAGMRVVVDAEWLERRRAKALSILAETTGENP